MNCRRAAKCCEPTATIKLVQPTRRRLDPITTGELAAVTTSAAPSLMTVFKQASFTGVNRRQVFAEKAVRCVFFLADDQIPATQSVVRGPTENSNPTNRGQYVGSRRI